MVVLADLDARSLAHWGESVALGGLVVIPISHAPTGIYVLYIHRVFDKFRSGLKNYFLLR